MSSAMLQHALQDLLRLAASHDLADARLQREARSLGLRAEAASALRWFKLGQQPCLGFHESLAARNMPRRLRLHGAELRVQAMRGGGDAALQSARMGLHNESCNGGPGTVTALLRSSAHAERSYALTAGHVLGAGGAGALNDNIAMTGIGSPLLGRNSDFLPSFHKPGEATVIDAGLVRLGTEQLQALLREGFELPQGQAGLYAGGQALSLRAQAAPRTATSVEEITCLMEPGAGGPAGSYQIVRGMLYQCAGGTEGGHSGAALWNERQELVGMHLGSAPAGSGGNAVAMPIGRAFSAWPSLFLITAPYAGEARMPTAEPVPAPNPTPSPTSQPGFKDVEVLARTLWGEARGEPRAGIEAVACVVLNRVRRQSYWGRSIAEVCLKPYQFSCWNQDDPNRRHLLSLSSSDPEYRRALDVAKAAIAGGLIDATQGATHYYSKRLRRPPVWALGHSASADIGLHLFFNKIR